MVKTGLDQLLTKQLLFLDYDFFAFIIDSKTAVKLPDF